MTDAVREHLLVPALQVAVPMWIEKIRPNLEAELKTAGDLAQIIAEKGDIILYKDRRKGHTAAAFNALAKAIALLSYAPGGVTVFGMHFESTVDNSTAGMVDLSHEVD